MQVAFATSPHGLGMPEEQMFWSLCPREWEARVKQWKAPQQREQLRFAELMSAVCNAWLPRQDGQRWSFYDWVPDEDIPDHLRGHNRWQRQSIEDQMINIKSMLEMSYAAWAGASPEQKQAAMETAASGFATRSLGSPGSAVSPSAVAGLFGVGS